MGASNNLRKDGYYSTKRVHINENGKVEKLKIQKEEGKIIYVKCSDNTVVNKNKTCFKDDVVNGRVKKEYTEDYVDYDYDYNNNSSECSRGTHYQDSNGNWHSSIDGW